MKEKLIKALEMLKQNRKDFSKKILETKKTVINYYYMGLIDETNFAIGLLEDIILEEENKK